MAALFLGNLTVKQHNTNLQQFQKLCLGVKVTAKDQLVILGVPLGDADKRGRFVVFVVVVGNLRQLVEGSF